VRGAFAHVARSISMTDLEINVDFLERMAVQNEFRMVLQLVIERTEDQV
jgi:hypothetical protein